MLSRPDRRHATPGVVTAGAPSLLDAVGPDADADPPLRRPRRCASPATCRCIQAGQFKTPFTREFLTSLADVETADRATVVDSLAPKRDLGVMVDYAIGSVSTLMLGAFNGEGQNVTANTDSTLLWVGRAAVRPIAFVTLGANFASYGSDSTRYGVDAAVEYMGRPIEGVHRTAPGRRRRG